MQIDLGSKRRNQILGAVIVIAFIILFIKIKDDNRERAIDCEFSSVVSSIQQSPNLKFILSDGTNLRQFAMSSEMEIVQLGDSLVKKKGENLCTVIRPDGETFVVKFTP